MYCKNCGKKLPDDARFCDRCNMSVRKKDNKMDLIVELKEERLARRKAKAIEERQKKIKRIKRKRRGIVLSVIAIILGLGVISGVIAYINYVKTSTFNETTEMVETTEAPTESAAPAVVIGGGQSNNETKPPVAATEEPVHGSANAYTEVSLAGHSFAYPSAFKEINDSKTLLSLTDGSAVITANKAVTSSAPKDLMKKYADETGGSPLESRANDTGYEITISVGLDIYHKKSIVVNGAEVYYEIRYPAASSNAAQYEADIEYMDGLFQ
ncbi:MAG: zinc ribbon domain-containing protein [Candidatus Ornithomonoglobus sp.]